MVEIEVFFLKVDSAFDTDYDIVYMIIYIFGLVGMIKNKINCIIFWCVIHLYQNMKKSININYYLLFYIINQMYYLSSFLLYK